MAPPDEDDDRFPTRPARGRNWEDEEQEEAERRRAEEEFLLLQAEQDEADQREVALEEMEEWFFSQFEDPQNETPYDSETGEYQYIWGGPFSASEMLGDQFRGRFPQQWIDGAVEHVEHLGTIEWAPNPSGDFYEHPDVDEAEEARSRLSQKILLQLDEVDRQLDRLTQSPPSVGHNRPPDEVGIPPYDEVSKSELIEATRITREELTSDVPNVDRLEKAELSFRKIGVEIVKWIGKKLDLAIDESIKAAVKVIAWGTLGAYILGIADDLTQFLRLIAGQ